MTVLLAVVLGIVSAQTTFEDVLREKELIVREMALSVQHLHTVSNGTCRPAGCSCLYGAFGSALNAQCSSAFGKCSDNCNEGKRRLDFANGVWRSAIVPTQGLFFEACRFRPLEQTFASLAHIDFRNPTRPQIEFYEKSTTKWMYFGSPHGLSVIYPGHAQKTPYGYDPRRRRWYAAATSGPKDVVIVLDVSGSMADFRRLDLAKDAVRAVFSTLVVTDFVGIVVFSDNSRQLCAFNECRLVRATERNINELERLLNALVPDGSTNMEAGLVSGMRLFSANTEHTSNCQRALLFLTDGIATVGAVDEALLKRVREDNLYDTVIFSYSLGSNADHVLPKKLACDTNGVWSFINDGGSLIDEMSQFYEYFAALSQHDDVVWVEPYEDASGAGILTTASLAVFAESNLIGVVGVDLLIADLERIEPNYNNLLNGLISRSNRCPTTKQFEGICALRSTRVSRGQRVPFPNGRCDFDPSNCTRVERCTDQTTIRNDEMYCATAKVFNYAEASCGSCECSANVETETSQDGRGAVIFAVIVSVLAGIVGLALLFAVVVAQYRQRSEEHNESVPPVAYPPTYSSRYSSVPPHNPSAPI